jgi:hypothetical protein
MCSWWQSPAILVFAVFSTAAVWLTGSLPASLAHSTPGRPLADNPADHIHKSLHVNRLVDHFAGAQRGGLRVRHARDSSSGLSGRLEIELVVVVLALAISPVSGHWKTAARRTETTSISKS